MGSAPQVSPTRTVVLLRPKDRARLEELAASERVSSGEILRRSLHAYDAKASETEQETLAVLLSEMNPALDGALASVRTARSAIAENLEKIREMQASAR